MPHKIRVTTPAAKALDSYQKDLRQRISDRIGELGINPRPADAILLGGSHGLLRVRVGNYRIVYQFQEPPIGLVSIVRIGHRRDVYRHLP